MLIDRPKSGLPLADLILAHGAGAPMDSPFMSGLTTALVAVGFNIYRFEFDYMAQRRSGGTRRPPPKINGLVDSYRELIATGPWTKTKTKRPLLIAGKSMGGRIATMLASEGEAAVTGVVAYGYPFRPPGKPDATARIRHFENLQCRALIVQGTRDAFGGSALVATLILPPQVSVHWLEGGDHDFGLRAGRDALAHQPFIDAANATASFVRGLKR